MADKNANTMTTAPTTGDRSPNYPGLTLEKAVEKARVIWDKEKRNFAPVQSIYSHWNYSASSSASRQTIAALKAFGLLEFRGAAERREAKLSQRALNILFNENREQELRAAALTPRLYRELVEMYPDGLPSDETMGRYLILQRGFNDKTVPQFIRDFKATLAYAGVVPGDTMDGQPAEKPPAGDGREVPTMVATNPNPPAGYPPIGPPPPGVKSETFALDRGEVIVRWPDRLTADEYKDIEDWLDILKRKIKRAVQEPASPAQNE